jgi:hypothetical protein
VMALAPIFACTGTHTVVRDPGQVPEERRLTELRERAASLAVELSGGSYCLAGRSCADRKEYAGPPACLAGLGVCDAGGSVELAERRFRR